MNDKQSKMFDVALSEAEADAAIKLFDRAVKADGLQVAAVALNLTAKLQSAFQKAHPQKPELKVLELADPAE